MLEQIGGQIRIQRPKIYQRHINSSLRQAKSIFLFPCVIHPEVPNDFFQVFLKKNLSGVSQGVSKIIPTRIGFKKPQGTPSRVLSSKIHIKIFFQLMLPKFHQKFPENNIGNSTRIVLKTFQIVQIVIPSKNFFRNY